MSEARRCAALTAKDEPCRMAVLGGSEYCFNHDPNQAAKRTLARATGGRVSRRPKGDAREVQLRDVDSILTNIEEAMGESWAMENSVARNRCIAHLASIALETLKVHSLDARLNALEDTLRGNLRRA